MSHEFDEIYSMLNCFRYTDTTGMTEQERKDRNKEDGFWTVQAFLVRLSENFLGQYVPYQELSIE